MEKHLHAKTKRRQQFRCSQENGKNCHSSAVRDEKPENMFRGILPSVEGIRKCSSTSYVGFGPKCG